MSYIRRSLEKIVLQVTKEYPVLLLSGPRQVGKTTMLKKLMEGTERNYVSLDDLQERELARTDPELFLQLPIRDANTSAVQTAKAKSALVRFITFSLYQAHSG